MMEGKGWDGMENGIGCSVGNYLPMMASCDDCITLCCTMCEVFFYEDQCLSSAFGIYPCFTDDDCRRSISGY